MAGHSWTGRAPDQIHNIEKGHWLGAAETKELAGGYLEGRTEIVAVTCMVPILLGDGAQVEVGVGMMGS